MRKLDLTLLAACFTLAGIAQADMAIRPVRACDAYIQEYCTSADKSLGCLKGYEDQVSNDCLADMEKKPARPPASVPSNESGISPDNKSR